ncbi:MAG: tetratricopeptide repeat protein [Xenococcaceae cyanobacterium]
MNSPTIQQLLEELKSPELNIRQQATDELWRIWFEQKGILGLKLLQRAQIALDTGNLARAEAILSETIKTEPDFAEAWNRRAVLYYTQGEFEKSKADCQRVIKLNSLHFGAWHGLGLCEFALSNYQKAIAAFHQVLTIQPYSLVNQKLILECTAKLN